MKLEIKLAPSHQRLVDYPLWVSYRKIILKYSLNMTWPEKITNAYIKCQTVKNEFCTPTTGQDQSSTEIFGNGVCGPQGQPSTARPKINKKATKCDLQLTPKTKN